MKIALSTIALFACTALAQHVTVIPAAFSEGQSKAQWISDESLDGPKVRPVNETAFDWWYFDAVSLDATSSLVVTFFTSTSTAFPLLDSQPFLTSVYVWTGFANGTTLTTVLNATEAIIETDGEGASGEWKGSGVSFEGSCDLKTYSVKFTSEGLKGTFKIKSVAPAHYPCGPAKKGQPMQVGPHIGWSNAIPDGDAIVDLEVFGTKLKFEGSGYHDKNWSDRSFFQSVGSWYWGHARVGPYSLVWYDFLTPTMVRYASSYLSEANKILSAACKLDSIKVRPFGGGSTYPSTVLSGDPDGFTIVYGNGFAAKVAKKNFITDGDPVYERWTGTIKGGYKGEKQYEGVAIYEEFKVFGLEG